MSEKISLDSSGKIYLSWTSVSNLTIRPSIVAYVQKKAQDWKPIIVKRVLTKPWQYNKQQPHAYP